ncbi:MAG: hypothetical protein DME80_14445 [Verrucomicrobia bacterium]|nr:MAG: hypothetical protein DME80_14445 [Verrucomicrobiota bacterium]
MKTKTILATLLIAAAASTDARFAWPYPRKAVSPDEIGHWVVINGNAWSHDVESELTTASPSGGGPDGLKSSPTKEKAELKTGVFHSAWPASAPCSPDSNALRRSRSSGSTVQTFQAIPRFKALIESSAVPASL